MASNVLYDNIGDDEDIYRTVRSRPDGGSGAMANNESVSSTNDDESTSAMSRAPKGKKRDNVAAGPGGAGEEPTTSAIAEGSAQPTPKGKKGDNIAAGLGGAGEMPTTNATAEDSAQPMGTLRKLFEKRLENRQLQATLSKNNEEQIHDLSKQKASVVVHPNPHIPKEPNSEIPFSRKHELRIVLVGKTAAGKSATGNTILGERVFESMASLSSVTTECKREERSWSERKLVVVDTPGLLHTALSHEETALEIGHCIAMSAPGPHAIVLVLQVGHFTQQVKDAAEKIQDIFGKKAMEYMIILFTMKDDLENETIQDYVKNSKERYLKELIRMCGDRYCAFNNKLQGQMGVEQVSELINMIDTMVSKNEARCYTNELYAQAEKKLRKKVAKMMESPEEFQKEIQKRKNEYELRIKISGKEVEEIENEVMKEIERKLQEMNAKNERYKHETEEKIRNLERELQRQNERFQSGDANRGLAAQYGHLESEIKALRRAIQEMNITSPIEMKKSGDQIQSNTYLNHPKKTLEKIEKLKKEIVDIEMGMGEQSKKIEEAAKKRNRRKARK